MGSSCSDAQGACVLTAYCRAQTLDDILDQMTRYNVLPKLINVTAEAGAPPIMPPNYVHREIVKGQLAPLGRFRGPLTTHTNYSTLHLYGPGLHAFADWQVQPAQGCSGRL